MEMEREKKVVPFVQRIELWVYDKPLLIFFKIQIFQIWSPKHGKE